MPTRGIPIGRSIHVVDKVDASTGHVRFDGVIKVRGNISDRYSVEGVRIEVGGTVARPDSLDRGHPRCPGHHGKHDPGRGFVLAQTITDAQVNAAENVVVYTTSSIPRSMPEITSTSRPTMVMPMAVQAGNLIRLPKVGPPEEFTREDEVEELPTTTTMLKSFRSPAENNSIRCWKTSRKFQ